MNSLDGYKVLTFDLLVLHDLINVIARSNRRRDIKRIKGVNILISSTSQMEGSRASPCSSSDDQNRRFWSQNWWRHVGAARAGKEASVELN